MKLEADHLKLGPGKVGVATIADVLDNRILLQFDGFDSTHHYWADITSPNIHPYNWHKTNKCRIIVAKGKFFDDKITTPLLTTLSFCYENQNTKETSLGIITLR